MKTVTAERMRKIEEKAADFGITPLILMENAGAAVAKTAENLGKNIVVLVCTGNNGGDGLVAARHLVSHDAKVRIFMLGGPKNIRTEETRMNWEIVRKIDSIKIDILKDADDVLKFRKEIARADVIVDAMLGTGVRGRLREPVATAVMLVNELKIPVVAVDVPTGVDPTTGEVFGDAIIARQTVTFHMMKSGLLKAKKYAGKIEVVGIGIPPEVERATKL